MKRVLLGLIAALSLAAFTTSIARADEKPADGTATPAKKTHKKSKKKDAAAADKTEGTTGTTTK
ncbi:MAG TPA: hypothetical protein VN947_11830 [Polyangia bacterium]|nr:hypothetical protein [Polyangia bacterium]